MMTIFFTCIYTIKPLYYAILFTKVHLASRARSINEPHRVELGLARLVSCPTCDHLTTPMPDPVIPSPNLSSKSLFGLAFGFHFCYLKAKPKDWI